MMKSRIAFFAFLLVLFLAGCKKQSPAQVRNFYLGVTPWPADFTPAAVDEAYAFINNHCDIVSHHFDEGIPYEEAFHQQPWPQALVNDLTNRKQKTAPGKTILLSVAPLNLTRHEKADYYNNPDAGITDSIKNYWKQLPQNDPRIITAYVNFVSYLIDQLHPQFVNYGVESNDISWDSTAFVHYKDFLSQVKTRLSTKYPALPFFISFMVNDQPSALSRASQLMPYTDYITLSSYPYAAPGMPATGPANPASLPADYYTRFLDLDKTKPWAFAETGFIAQDLVIPAYSLNRQSNNQWQYDYLNLIMDLANLRKAKFIIWFCSSDYDAGDNRLKQLGLYQDLFALWQDTGLRDEQGTERPSFKLWDQWMGRPHQ
jgi:hypothetical protein